jgi:hypothetical protein
VRVLQTPWAQEAALHEGVVVLRADANRVSMIPALPTKGVAGDNIIISRMAHSRLSGLEMARVNPDAALHDRHLPGTAIFVGFFFIERKIDSNQMKVVNNGRDEFKECNLHQDSCDLQKSSPRKLQNGQAEKL